ncbi:MAG TPA: lytic transglycosylase domain-containing protein [Rhodanobacter sp.]|nr:lytic transglycosylase domain-containing protein [Rhodanobacter sp.]
MATVIDSLVVRLGLDSTDFKKGQADTGKALKDTGKAADKTARDLQDSGKRAAEFFTSLTGAALKFFAVLSAGRGLADFTRSTIQGGAEVNRLARNLGMAASTISQWGNAVEVAGGDAGAFQGTLRNLSSSLTEMKLTGTTGILPYLRALGVAVADTSGNARPLDAVLLDIGDKLKALPSRADAFNIGKMMGLDEGTINLLLRGRTEVRAMLEEQRKGVALTDEQAKKSEEAAQKWAKVKQQLEANGRELIYKLMPAMEQLTQLMVKLSEVAVPFLVEAVDLFTQLDHATDGWSTKIIAGIALFRILGGGAILSGILSLSKAILGINTAAGTVAAGGGLTALLSRLAALTKIGGVLGLLLHSEGATSQSELDFGADVAKKYGRKPGAPTGPAAAPSSAKSLFDRLESQYGLPKGLLDSVWAKESARGTKMQSKAGAMGHFQFMPATAKQYGLKNPNDLAESADAAARYYRDLIKQFGGNLPKALAAYNWGPNNVKKYGLEGAFNVPETRDYVASLLPLINGGGSVPLAFRGASAAGGAAARAPAGAVPSSTTVTVGQVTVNTQATDARGIARDLRGELVAQANTGMD